MNDEDRWEIWWRGFTWGQVISSIIWLALLGSFAWRLDSQIKSTESFAGKMGYGKYVTSKDGVKWFKWKIVVPE